MENERGGWGGTVESVSRWQILRRERGQGNHEQDYPVDPYSGESSVYLHVCMVSTFRRVWINRVMLPFLLVVSLTWKMIFSLSPFAPENSV